MNIVDDTAAIQAIVEKITYKIFDKEPDMHCFSFKFGYIWQGVVFSDGHVCIRGRCIGRTDMETHQYTSMSEMQTDLLLKPEDIVWQTS